MCLEYHYSWPCGHKEYLGRAACETSLPSTDELSNTLQITHTTSSLSLGEPHYPCSACSDTPESVLSLIEALSARLETYRRESEISLERAAAARAEHLRARQAALTNRVNERRTTPRRAPTYQEAVEAMARRIEQDQHQRLSDYQEEVIRRAEGGLSPPSPPVLFNPNPAVADFVPGAACWVPDEPQLVNGHHILPRAQALEHMAYLWDGNEAEADPLKTETASLGLTDENGGMDEAG